MERPVAPLTPGQVDAAFDLMGTTGGVLIIPVRDGDTSMLPTLAPGQPVAVECFPEADRNAGLAARLGRGDLLVFRQSDYRVVHRLVGRARPVEGRPALRTRGDGRPRLDPPVEPHRVLARAIAIRDARGWWDLAAPGARFYASCLAWHHLGWAVLSRGGRAADAMLRGVGLAPVAESLIGRLDRLLLSLVHRAGFVRLHSRPARGIPGPEPDTAGGPDAAG
jgi:hypothetical protein